MLSVVFFLLSALALFGLAYALWRFWEQYARRTPEEEAFDARVAALNRRQANRISDEDLTHPLTEDEAWKIMVHRGKNGWRRERYSGNLSRRQGEKRRRP